MDLPAKNKNTIQPKAASLDGEGEQKRNRVSFLAVFVIAIVVFGVGFSAYYFLKLRSSSLSPSDQQDSIDKVLVTVAGKKIRESDLKAYDFIYNAEARYQQLFSTKSAELAPREKVLDSLVRVTKIEIAAKKEGVTVSDQDIEAEVKKGGGQQKIQANINRYNWTFDDWKRSREIVLREQKLSEKVLEWRLGEFVSVRWDVIPKKVEGDLVGVYQDKSRTALKKIEERFNLGEEVDKLAVILRSDQSVLADFTKNAIQSNKLGSDPQIRFMQRVVKSEKNFDWQNHVLELGSKVQSDLWCSEFSCYLTRVLDGNDGKYINLEDYLNAEVK